VAICSKVVFDAIVKSDKKPNEVWKLSIGGKTVYAILRENQGCAASPVS